MKVLKATEHGPRVAVPTVRPQPSKPVKLWAGIGTVSMAVILSSLARWINSPDFRATPHGPDRFTGWHADAIQVIQIVLFASAAWLIWSYLVRPLIRERTLAFDGMLIIAGCFAGFFETFGSMFNVSLVYNTHLWNFGSWAQFIPGWRTPNAETLVMPILFVFAMYIWFVAGFVFLGCWILGRLQARYPTKSTMTLVTALFGICFALDFAFEFVILRTEIYAYAGIPHDLSLWHGKYYQYPVHSALLGATVLTGLSAFRYFRDDTGLTFAQRGVNDLAIPRQARRFVSTLAVIGFAHFWVVVGYFVPFNLFVALQADTAPALPSYMRDGMCGEGTDYACPSEYVPVPTGGDSLHVRPDDPRLPQWVRDRQGL